MFMKITNLDAQLKNMKGDVLKEQTPEGVKPITLRKAIIEVLSTERIVSNDRQTFKTVNEKSEDQKLSDFNLGWKISQAKNEIDLKATEVSRIIELAHYLDTNTYGAIMQYLDK